MPIIQVVIIIIVVGVLLYLVHRYIPMDPTVKNILTGVVIFALVLWLLNLYGLLGT